MIKLKELLNKNDLKATRYEKRGSDILVNTNKGKYIIKKEKINNKILDYLKNRSCHCYLETIDHRSDYNLYPYIEEINIPNEQKMNDLIKFIAFIHRKTSYEKQVDQSEYKQIYEDLKNNVLYLKEYYNDLITIIDTKVYYRPDEYLLARNISIINNCLDNCEKAIDEWYNIIKDLNKKRVCVVHNNLSLDNFIESESKYLISWDKSKIDIPIFDLYKLYCLYHNEYNFQSLINLYEKDCILSSSEKELLQVLMSMPNKILLSDDIYNNCIIIKNEVKRLIKCLESVNKE